MKKNTTCPKCGKDFPEIMGFSYQAERFIGPKGMCEKCFVKSKGLIEVGNHYVPWNYHFEPVTEKPSDEKFYEDVNAELPRIEWSEEHKKYKLTFESADMGGYDSMEVTWYFDSLDDILKELGITDLN